MVVLKNEMKLLGYLSWLWFCFIFRNMWSNT